MTPSPSKGKDDSSEFNGVGHDYSECTLNKAEHLFKEEKLLEAARILKKLLLDPQVVLEERHHSILRKAEEGEEMLRSLKADVKSWKDLGVQSGKFPTQILYEIDKTSTNKTLLRVRCETPVQKDLIMPLLSVIHESQHYHSWIPRWSVPRFQMRFCRKLKEVGRLSQIFHFVNESPWPMKPIEIIMSYTAIDDIEAAGDLAIKMVSVTSADNYDDCVPEPDKKCNSIGFDGGILIQKCPKNAPVMEKVRNSNPNAGDDTEGMILVRYASVLEFKSKFIPQWFLSFLIKVALGTSWKVLFGIALDVKNGKRPEHSKVIKEKREAYDYIESRVDALMGV
jgi:hypothetical protein